MTTGESRQSFSLEEAREVGEELGIDWSRFDVEQFRTGLNVELEHGTRDPTTDLTGDDPILTGKIALAHLKEFPDYYDRLERMKGAAKFDHGLMGKTARTAGRVWGEMEERVGHLRTSLEAFEEKLEDARDAGGERWEAAKTDLEEGLSGLKSSLERLGKRVKIKR